MTDTRMEARRLVALDEDDLAVVSTHVQDAAVRIGEIHWRPAEKRFVLGMQRIDWDQVIGGKPQSRCLVSALRFDRVLSCKSRNIDLDATDTTLDLLGIEFHPAEPPGGSAVLMFAGGGVLRLDVECLECELADLGPDGLATTASGEDAGPSGQET